MAIYSKKNPSDKASAESDPLNTRSSGLGRGLNSLSGDNQPPEKKPLVVRRGVCSDEEIRKKPIAQQQARAPKKTTQPPGVGGRVVIRTEKLPEQPLASSRSARKGTTVLVRTERDDPPRRYRVNERIALRDARGIREGLPIVINPRKKK